MPADENPIGVAVLGLGNVGSEVVRIVWSDLGDPAAIIAEIRDARRLALQRRAAMAR